MKKITVILVAMVCFICTYLSVAQAETITGSTASAKTFYIRSSYDNSYIVLSSSTGVANVAQHNWAGIYEQDGYETHHGFYKVTQKGGGVNRSFIWAPSATINTSAINTCEEVQIYFPAPGEFTVTIAPLSFSSASAYWKVDYIKYWVHDASWMTTITSGCTVTSTKTNSTPTKVSNPTHAPIPQTSAIPYFPTGGYTVWLRNPNVERIQPQCGPGYNYSVFASMSGSTKLYKPRDITYLSAHFCVGNWAYIEFGYSDGVLRYGFFEKSLFDPSVNWNSIPSYSLSDEKRGRISSETTPYNGPSTNCGSYASCRLYSGDTVYACMECNGWYLCRFYNNHSNNYGNVYLWVPGYNITWN